MMKKLALVLGFTMVALSSTAFADTAPRMVAQLKTTDLSFLGVVMIHPTYAKVVSDLMADEVPNAPFPYMVSSAVVTRDDDRFTARVTLNLRKLAKYGMAPGGQIVAELDIVIDAPPIVTAVYFVPAPAPAAPAK